MNGIDGKYLVILFGMLLVSCGPMQGDTQKADPETPSTVKVVADPGPYGFVTSMIGEQYTWSFTRASDPLTDLNDLRSDGAAGDSPGTASGIMLMLGEDRSPYQKVGMGMRSCVFDRNPELQWCLVHRDHADRIIASGGIRIEWVNREELEPGADAPQN